MVLFSKRKHVCHQVLQAITTIVHFVRLSNFFPPKKMRTLETVIRFEYRYDWMSSYPNPFLYTLLKLFPIKNI